MSTLHRTIVRPIVTERTSAAYQSRGEYVFEVATDATKPAIKQAIERLFGVKVTGVWTMNARGKTRRVGRGAAGQRPNWKKAIVTLRDGDTIEGYGFEG
jgi:large subunit ribosomal protein L23